MAEEATMTKPVSADAPVKVEPQDIKGFLVQNLRAAAGRITANTLEADKLRNAVRDQADYIEEGHISGFYKPETAEIYEKGLAQSNNQITFAIAQKGVLSRLSNMYNYPSDKAVASQFDAIVEIALKDAINSRAVQLGQKLVGEPSLVGNPKEVVNER